MDPATPPADPRPLEAPGDPKARVESLKILIKAIEQSPVSVIITDPRGVIQYVNPKFTQLMGFTMEEAVGKTPRILKGGFLSRDFYKDMWDTILAGKEWHGLFHNRTKAGDLVWELSSISPIRDEAGTITHFVGVKEDITELKRLQDQMAHMAQFDQLTGLPNRFLFMDRLRQVLVQSKRRDTTFAVLYLDLDAFKDVNDTYGHTVGDRLLSAVGQRLLGCVRESDTVARMGGDEYTILLTDLRDLGDVERIAGMILKAISNPFRLGDVECTVGISIGVSIFPLDGLDADPLLSTADSALYQVKRGGRGGFHFPAKLLMERPYSVTMGTMRLGLSVREFVAPLEPSGSIDARRSLAAEEDPMALGAKLHARVQKRLAKEDARVQGEVAVRAELELDGFRILVRGRIDVLVACEPPVVEEIKTSFRPALTLGDLAEDPDHPFALQARMYAWLRWREDGRVPACRLRLISLLDETETLVAVPFEPGAFSAWVEARQRALREAWARAEARREERRGLAGRLAFPFPEPRPGQAELTERVASALASGGRMLLQAPTGLGKTAAILFPAVARALQDDLRVFYCTPRNSQHEVAEDCVRRMRARGHDVRSVTVKAKERVCPQPEVDCRPEVCPRALLYFDRLKASGAVDALMAEGCADTAALAAMADRHTLCPYELSLDAARHADVVIGDYNYVFAPASTLARFFGTPEESARNVVLVDEAHNLPARAADWFSPGLDLAWLEELRRRRAVPKDRALRARLTAQLKRCQALLQALEGPHRVLALDPQPFLGEEARIARLAGETAARGLELKAAHPLVELQRAWADFCAVLRILDAPHIVTWIPPGRLQITCADASGHLETRMGTLASAVLFSATLKPFQYHQRLAGLGGAEVLTAEVPSPFPAGHRKLLVVPQISTLYRRREEQAPRIAHLLQRVLPLRFGNYCVFFPSYELLDKVLPHLDLPGFDVRVQPRRAKAAQLDELLSALRERQGVVVLAVQGGSLSEGVDLPGEALIGCVVAGPALPPFDLERERIRAYFQAQYGCGQAYAYIYPAAAKAVQAAGRVIRTPLDRGLLIFLDGRFLDPDYVACFPEGWLEPSPGARVSASILADVAAFWAE